MCVLCRSLGSELNTLWHSEATAVYGDLNETPIPIGDTPQHADAASWGPQTRTYDSQADGLLSGDKWIGLITYSFTDSSSDYGSGYGSGEPYSGFAKVTTTEQQVINTAIAQIQGFTNIAIQRIDGSLDYTADIRIARSSVPDTAWAYYPDNSPEGGDVWIGNSYPEYSTPRLGDYGYVTHIHELGHALGLKHPHESGGVAGPLPSDHDALEFSVMSYRSYVGASTTGGYTNEEFGYPQSYMMNDIAALQKLYGADFSLNSNDTVYKWSPTTGQMLINNIGQDTPGANRVFLTIWDGGGNDTYDMSNYSTNVTINLTPGLWSVTSAAQKAYLGDGHYAQGNVYNAFLYDPDGTGSVAADTRSYIENATGGAGNDTLIGNAVNNQLDGGTGNDTLTGGAGDDLFFFHSGGGRDIVTDFTAGGLTDEIYFDFTNVTSFTEAMSYATQVGADTVFNFGTSGTLTLLNVTRGNLTSGDFQYSHPATVSILPPSDIALSGNTVAENAAGATVGSVTVSDPDGDTSFTFTVSDDRFQVVGNPGSYSLVLKSGVTLDYETESSVGLDITATDNGGFWRQEHFTLDVLDRGGVTITGTKNADIIDATHTAKGQPLPTNDGDTIKGMNGNDVISAGSGNDMIYGGSGSDTLSGNDGDDTFFVAGSEASGDTMSGGAGTDTIQVSGTSNVTLGGFGGNSIEVWSGNGLAVVGTKANNVLDFSGLTSKTGLSYIDGGSGNDTITGSSFADELRGNNGNDILNGGSGDDLLNGGGGADTFVFNGNFGNDRITGFVAGTVSGHDLIQFDDAQFADFAAVMAHATQVGSDVVIALDGNNSVTLQSMTLAKLVAADFQFV